MTQTETPKTEELKDTEDTLCQAEQETTAENRENPVSGETSARQKGTVGATEKVTRTLTCIGCPRGCAVTVTLENGVPVTVAGNTCKIGDTYARKEVTNPTRIVTTSVRVEGGTIAMVSCKTASDIPKGRIFDVIEALKGVTVQAPVKIGDVLLPDVCGTGVDIVATRDVAHRSLK